MCWSCHLPTMWWVIIKPPAAQPEPKWWDIVGLTLKTLLGEPWPHKYVFRLFHSSDTITVTVFTVFLYILYIHISDFLQRNNETLFELQQILQAEELYKSCISSVVLRGDHSGTQTFIHHHFVPCHVSYNGWSDMSLSIFRVVGQMWQMCDFACNVMFKYSTWSAFSHEV